MSDNLKATPSKLSFVGTAVLDLEAKSADGSPKLPTFKIHGYSGAPLNVSGFFSPVIVDLGGIKPTSQTIPALLDHDTGQIVGQTDSIKIDSSGINLDGIITGGDEPAAMRVKTHSKNGFKWQASIGAEIIRREFLAAGEKATVNGRQVSGPLLIARQSRLYEISFTALGADSSTSANVAAKGQANVPEITTTDAEVQDDTIRAERELDRIRGIRLECGPDFREVEASAIDEGWTLERTKAEIIAKIRNRAFGGGGGGRRVSNNNGGGGISTRDRLVAAAMTLGGHGQIVAKHMPNGEQLANSVPRLSGWYELAAYACQLEGVSVSPHDRMATIKASFSTLSMPAALSSSIERIALPAFLEQSKTFLPLVRTVNSSNFRPTAAVRLIGRSGFSKVGPTGELKHSSLGEASHELQNETRGGMLSVTRQDLVNDDLNLLADIPTVLANEASGLMTDDFYNMLIGNAGNWFGVGNGNLLDADLDVAGLSEAITTLRTRKNEDGRVIGFSPAFLVIPAALEATARVLLNSQVLSRASTVDQGPTASPFAGVDIQLIVEPRLDDDDDTAWYLVAPSRHGAFLMSTLNGRLGPIVEQADLPAELLGMQWRAYVDYDFALGEYRAAVKSVPGA